MNDQAAESPTRDGPGNTGLLQAAGAPPIVQTYCVEEAVPKGNKFERYDGLAPDSCTHGECSVLDWNCWLTIRPPLFFLELRILKGFKPCVLKLLILRGLGTSFS
jgi:hypothetical protein